jgi:hypothetical protein
MLFYNDKPNLSVINLSDFHLSKNEIYYVGFFYQGNFHTRKVELIGSAVSVYNHNFSICLRKETDWKYIYKSKDGFGKLIEKEIKYLDDSGYSFDRLNLLFIGKSPIDALIRLCILNSKASNIDDYILHIYLGQLDFYKKNYYSLYKYLEEKLYGESLFSEINYSEYFIKNTSDIDNDIFFS